MSLILEGIDMPKTEYEEVIIRIKHTGEVCDAQNIHLYAQATEIPTPHGRLIDADNIDYDDFWYREGQGFTIAVCQGAQRIIEEQPTILEAEE